MVCGTSKNSDVVFPERSKVQIFKSELPMNNWRAFAKINSVYPSNPSIFYR